MALSKVGIASICGALVVVSVVAGGYGFSISMHDSLVENSRAKLESLIKESKVADTSDIKVLTSEDPNSSLLTRNLTLRIEDKNTYVTIPVVSHIGFLSYDFDILLDQAKEKDQVIKDLYPDLININANIKASAFSDTATLIVNGTYYNHIAEQFADSMANRDRDYITKFNVAPQSNVKLVADIKKDLSGKATATIDNLLLGATLMNGYQLDLDIKPQSNGFYPGILDLSSQNIAGFLPNYKQLETQGYKMHLDYTNIQADGALDLKYSFSADKFAAEFANINLSGNLTGLNLKLLQNMTPDNAMANLFSLMATNYELNVDPTSGFTFIAQDAQPQQYNFSLEGNAQYLPYNKDSLTSKIVVSTKDDLMSLQNSQYQQFTQFFTKEGDAYKANIDIKLNNMGRTQISVNNQRVL